MAKSALTQKKVKTASGRQVIVARKNASEKSLIDSNVITNTEMETDKRARGATKAAIVKAKVCKTPIARFDTEKNKAYLEYADGKRVYVE